MHIPLHARPNARPIFAVVVCALALLIPAALTTLSPTQASAALTGGVVVVGALGLIGWLGIPALATAAVFVAAALLPFNGLKAPVIGSLADLLLVASGVLVLPVLFADDLSDRLRPYKPLFTGFVLIFVSGFVASAASSDVEVSLARLIRLVAATIALTLVVAFWSPSVRQVQVATWVFSGGVAVNALAAALGVNFNIYNGRSMGWTLHPNHLALGIVLAFGPTLSLIVMHRGIPRLAALGMLSAMLAGLEASGSRAGIIGVAVCVLAYAVARRRYGLAIAIAGAGGFAAVVARSGVVHFSETNALGRLFGGESNQFVAGSDVTRSQNLRASLDTAFDNPIFGAGLADILQTHNVYVQLWASMGFLALAGMAVLILGLRRTIVRALAVATPSQSALIVGLASGYAGFLVAEAFQNAMWERFMWLSPALICAVAARVHHDHCSNPSD